MKSIRIHQHGSSDVLKIDNHKVPQCKNDELLVNIKACSINHLDIWVRNGLPGLPINLPLILGSDASGTIVEKGINVKKYNIGDDVVIQPGIFDKNCPNVISGNENYSSSYGILGEHQDGVQSEYIALKPENVHLKPKHLTFVEAASMQLVFMTSYQMLVKRASLKSFETVLIYGGTSGIGAAAIQIAKDIGAKVITTVGSDSKFDHALKFGADYVFNHSKSNWVKGVKDVLDANMVDVVFEHIGKNTWDASMRLLGRGGRIVTCGSTTGYDVNIDLRHLFSKQQAIIGSTMSDMDTFKKVQEKITKNIYTPFVDKIYSISDIKKAHKRIEDRQNLGKVVISLH